jgi:hypothetical protein
VAQREQAIAEYRTKEQHLRAIRFNSDEQPRHLGAWITPDNLFCPRDDVTPITPYGNPDTDVLPVISSRVLKGARDVEGYYASLADSTSRFFTSKALRLGLAEEGLLSRMVKRLSDICLLQGGPSVFDTLIVWEEIAFADVNFSMPRLIETMRSGFSAMWVRQDQSNFKEDFPLVLSLALNTDTSNRASNNSPSPFDLLPHVALQDTGSLVASTELWMFPAATVRRYSDLFVCLLFWRWVTALLNKLWRLGIDTNLPHVWLLTAQARGVLSALIHHAWYGVAEAVRKHRQEILEGGLFAQYIERFTIDHDEFLAQCSRVCLLTPEFSRARQQLRSLVRQLEEVLNLIRLTRRSSHELLPVLLQKSHTFNSTACLLVKSIEEVQDAEQNIGNEIRQSLRFMTEAYS